MTVTSTLADIRAKFRRVTRSPSVNQITDGQIDDYVNTFYLNDFPEQLRLKDMFTNYEFTTQPNQDTYDLPNDVYVTVEPPIYINGYQSFYTQSQNQFYTLYPKLCITSSTASGDGTVGPFTFTLSNQPVLQNNVVISAGNGNGYNLVATDTPKDQALFPNEGDLTGPEIAAGSVINYLTGVITIEFTQIIPLGTAINCQVVPYAANQPTACLFYHNQFTLRPVPDDSYLVSIAAYQYPTAFLTSTDHPEIDQWWQAIALGASLKFFEDRGDFQQLQAYYPLYDQQMRLALRRTIVQQTTERTATIYTDQVQFPNNGNFFNNF